MTSFFSDIVREPTLNFRSVALGTPIDQVLALEGEPAELREASPSGPQGFASYKFELGEVEELTISYAFHEDRLVRNIEVILTSYPFFYWKRLGAKYPDDWYEAVNSVALAPLTPAWTATRDALVEHFTTLSGSAPRKGKPVGGFSQKQNDGKTWAWTTPELHISLISYFDDRSDRLEDVCNFLKLTVARP